MSSSERICAECGKDGLLNIRFEHSGDKVCLCLRCATKVGVRLAFLVTIAEWEGQENAETNQQR